jgi:hypothetical protein
MLPPLSVWQRNFRPVFAILWELLRCGLQFLNVVARSRTAVAAEVLVLAKAASLLPGSPGSASPPDRCGTIVVGPLVPAFRLERSARHSDAWDLRPLASKGFLTVLELEVTRRPASASQGHTPAHRPDGNREHNLGRRSRYR